MALPSYAEGKNIPDWVRKERQGDLDWIRENLDFFQLVATAAFKVTGRGAIVVDTTSRPVPDKGHPHLAFYRVGFGRAALYNRYQ